MQDFERLGAFYLGRVWDPVARRVLDDPVLYDARDLTTHAVCVGMTGSGKTGLGVSLLEEAAIDAVPAIAIDPKGDLGNLLLTFPELRAADFRPWIDPTEAAREGLDPDGMAERTAGAWREGLAAWGQDGARIARLRQAADIALYTPGSSAGRPLAILRSFAAPSAALRDDPDALRERGSAAVSGLLALLGVDADPIRSRDHILLATIVEAAWRDGRDLDLASLIAAIQRPPVPRIGVVDLETFYPANERFALAMTINNLLASPGFAAWLEGEPLDVARLLWTPAGKPRLAVLSIAHLSEPERMFFVTLLLNEVLAWVRTQPGSTSLRALVYMDEVFGYLPPVAHPPSKTPLLTLLKQARAFGLGVVLATQNPVDLDYKALSNAGTWFLGRLQTERDKARVLDGLEGAAATAGRGLDRAAADAALSGLGKRVFLMHNVHDDAPTLFHTRQALSFLRGPLTRAEIRTLTGAGASAAAAAPAAPRPEPPAPAPSTAPAAAVAAPPAADSGPPVVPPDVRQRHLAGPAGSPAHPVTWRPHLLGLARVRYRSSRHGVDERAEVGLLAPLDGADAPHRPWEGAVRVDPSSLRDEPAPPASRWAALPAGAADPDRHARWSRELRAHVARDVPLVVWHAPALGETSRPGEDEAAFRVRLAQRAREERDRQVDALRARYAPKLASLAERVRRAEERVAREQSQYGQQKLQTAISVGATLLGAMFGRKLVGAGTVGRATTAARGASRTAREREEVGRAEDALELARSRLDELETSFREETATLEATLDPSALPLERLEIGAKTADVDASPVALAWIPDGARLPGGMG